MTNATDQRDNLEYELLRLIGFYKAHGWDWTVPAEFTLARARGETWKTPCNRCPWRKRDSRRT